MPRLAGEGPIWGDNGRWSRTNLRGENVPGVNLQAYALADDMENCLPRDIVISPSFHLLCCLPTPSYHSVVQLVIIPSGQLCPLCQPHVPFSDSGSFPSTWQTHSAAQIKHWIYSPSSSETRGDALTCSTSRLKFVPLHWLKSTHAQFTGQKRENGWYL